MAPYEGVAVPESEDIEQSVEELQQRFRCGGGGVQGGAPVACS